MLIIPWIILLEFSVVFLQYAQNSIHQSINSLYSST